MPDEGPLDLLGSLGDGCVTRLVRSLTGDLPSDTVRSALAATRN